MNIIDLSYPVETGMPSIPSAKHVKTEIKEISNIEDDGIERHQILMSCHSGTHMDTPLHMLSRGKKVGDVSSDSLAGKGRKLKIPKGEFGVISKEDIARADLGGIDFLIIQTGWSEQWGGDAYYERHPYFSEEAMVLLAKSDLKGLLVDLPNVDHHEDKEYGAHKVWLARHDILVENVCNLEALDERDYLVVIAPLKLVDSEAAPVRCFAIDGFN